VTAPLTPPVRGSASYDAPVPRPQNRELAAGAGALLEAAGLTVGLAESCTGGLLCAELTAVPGSSAYVVGGVTAYANSLKTSLLGVPKDLIATNGAVSAEVATSMAIGVRALLRCDIGLAASGIAGPVRDASEKPAGLCYVALVEGDPPLHLTRLFTRNEDLGRHRNRSEVVALALRGLVEHLTARQTAAPGGGAPPRSAPTVAP